MGTILCHYGCENTDGSAHCTCQEGYEVHNTSFCIGKQAEVMAMLHRSILKSYFHPYIETVMVVIVWQLDLQVPWHSMPFTT